MTTLSDIRQHYATAPAPADAPLDRPAPPTRKTYQRVRTGDVAPVLLYDDAHPEAVQLMVQTIAWLHVDRIWATRDCRAVRAAAEVEAWLAEVTR